MGKDIAFRDQTGLEEMTEIKRPGSNRVVHSVSSASRAFDRRIKKNKKQNDVHIRPASLFCLLSSLIKCKVGRESL